MQVASTQEAKDAVMNNVLRPAAWLAHIMGYGWAGGCDKAVGEGFIRKDDGWQAETKSGCQGYKADHRLGLVFSDWSFGLYDFVWEAPRVTELKDAQVEEGVEDYTDWDAPVEVILKKTHREAWSTTNTLEQGFEVSVGFEFESQQGVKDVMGTKEKFTFNFKGSMKKVSTEVASGEDTFEISRRTTVPARSKLPWRLVQTRRQVVLRYTAFVEVKFALELKGFLRWGANKPRETNYHRNHKGSGDRPTFNYKIGSASESFPIALKRLRDNNIDPWLWDQMATDWGDALPRTLNQLNNRATYVFPITGQLDNVRGLGIDLKFGRPVTLVQAKARMLAGKTKAARTPDQFHLKDTRNWV
jgi:hypothetical protein